MVRLQHVLGVQPAVAALVVPRGRRPRRRGAPASSASSTTRSSVRACHVEADQVAVLDERERPADGRLRARRAARRRRTRCRSCARRRCARGRRRPACRSFAGIGRCPHSGIPGPPTGPALRSTITLLASHSRSGSSTRAARSWMSSKTIARALVLQQGGVGGADLHHGAVRAQAAAAGRRARRRRSSGSSAGRITSGFDDLWRPRCSRRSSGP